MGALLSKMAPKGEPQVEEPAEDGGAGTVEGIIAQLEQEVLPAASPEKAAKVQQAIDILVECLEGGEEPAPEEELPSPEEAAGSGLPPM